MKEEDVKEEDERDREERIVVRSGTARKKLEPEPVRVDTVYLQP